MTETKYKMTFEEIMKGISGLSKSQGSYGRMLNSIQELEQNDPERYEELKEQWSNKFTDLVDFILYIES